MRNEGVGGSEEEGRLHVLAYLEHIVNGREHDRLDEFVDAGYVGHGFAADREALRAFLGWQAATAPDWQIEVKQSAAEGELVAVQARASGTRAEEAPGVPFAAPRRMAFDWMSIYRLDDGRIAEAWVVSREVPPEG